MKFIRKYLFSFDFVIALILSFIVFYKLNKEVSYDLSKDLLSVGINILTLIFSIFFAALAFMISSSDDEFVAFLEEENMFTTLVNSFKWTLWSLFIALAYCIILYISITYEHDLYPNCMVNRYFILLYCFTFFYALIATLLSTSDAINYAQRRIKFVVAKKTKNDA